MTRNGTFWHLVLTLCWSSSGCMVCIHWMRPVVKTSLPLPSGRAAWPPSAEAVVVGPSSTRTQHNQRFTVELLVPQTSTAWQSFMFLGPTYGSVCRLLYVEVTYHRATEETENPSFWTLPVTNTTLLHVSILVILMPSTNDGFTH